MKQAVCIIFLLAALCLALAGCRTRTVADPLLADTVIVLTPPPTERPAETEPPEPEETPPPPTETAAPTETAPPEVTEAPVAAAAPTGGGSGPSGAGSAAQAVPAPPEQPREPERTDATVTFDGNGGRVKSREARLRLGDGAVYGALPAPLREGYGFLGWFTAPEDGEEITSGSIFSGAGDLTLYAHWEYDPVAFWGFTLQNRTQQVYLCQQTAIYYEAAEEGVTQQSVGLISDTGSLNVAENRDDPKVTDDWVQARKPGLILKCLDAAADAGAVRQAVAARFPGTEVALVSPAALGSGEYGLYARLALAKHLYGDWYADVDLDTVAEELGVKWKPIIF